MKRLILLGLLTVTSPLLSSLALAQRQGTTPTPKPANYAGCVTAIPKVDDALVLATEDRCLLLQGKFDAAAIRGRHVTVKGSITDAADLDPDTLHIEKVVSVNAACTRACTLEPPGTRSLHGKSREHPGKEGATQGLHDGTPPQ